MKFFLISLCTLVASLNSFACPDLSGKYMCDLGQGNQSLIEVENDEYQFKITTNGVAESFILDGEERIINSGYLNAIHMTAECKGKKIIAEASMPHRNVWSKVIYKAEKRGMKIIRTTKSEGNNYTQRVSCLLKQ